MEKFASASALVAKRQPDLPLLGLRPHAAGRAARWFLDNFPGDVAYAYKANSSVFLLGALYGAGIRHFDVASLAEISDAATIPGAELHFMHPVKARDNIRRAYFDYGLRSFALDSEDELAKIMAETGGAKDLLLWVRLAVQPLHSRMPLDRKYGISGVQAARLLMHTRNVAAELGVTFHVGSQTISPDAFVKALDDVAKLMANSGVTLDRLDVGGGFPARYGKGPIAPLSEFMTAISKGVARAALPAHCRLMCEPGRALVAEAESLIVKVDARRGNELFINEGTYGILFDAGHMGWLFPVRMVSQPGAAAGRMDQAPVRQDKLLAFSFWGPSCDTIDFIEGPFMLPSNIGEGDYIEIGMTGAYGRALASRFNGYGDHDEAILLDEPMYSMFQPAARVLTSAQSLPA